MTTTAWAISYLVLAEVGTWVNPLSPDPREREEARRLITDRLALAEALGGMEALRVGETTVEWSPELREEDVEALRGALPPGTVVRLGLPPVTRAWEREALETWMARAWERGQRAWEIANLDGLERLRKVTGLGARELDVTADWWVWAWNLASVASLLGAGVRRVGCSPEDTAENVAAVAERYPWRMTWGVLRDPPLFLSEHCPEAARRGGCPGPATCGYRGRSWRATRGRASWWRAGDAGWRR